VEYFLGSLVTLLSLFIFNLNLKKISNRKLPIPTLTQSRKLVLVKSYISELIKPKPEPKTQSKIYSKKNSIKVFFIRDTAYWIENGFLVTAKLKNNEIDENTKKRVDTHALDKLELDKISFIVDRLTEGDENDNRNSRN